MWRAIKNRVALASFPANFHANFIHLATQDGSKGKHAADTLVYEIFRGTDGIRRLGLTLAAGKAVGVVPTAEPSNAEMVGRTELIIVVTEKGEEILILIVWPR